MSLQCFVLVAPPVFVIVCVRAADKVVLPVHGFKLHLELVREPKVVVVQDGDKVASKGENALVAYVAWGRVSDDFL
jgi:hypothetical protein